MNIAYFTKTLEGLPLEKAAEVTAGLGFDCADLLVRDGQAVTPERPEEIVKAANLFAAGGLRVPMATIDAIRPDDAASRLLGFCGEAGIGQVRLGFWRYDPSQRWKVQVDEARRDLDGFERLAERFAVKLTIQLHGGTLHSSGALAMHLLAGRDPVRIGAYPDPANQVIREGTEDWRLTLDLLDPWFCCMGVKNSGWFPGVYGAQGQRTWHSDWYGLDDGMVPWNEIIPHLVATGFAGVLSMHSQYRVPREQALDKIRADLTHLRRLVAAAKEQNLA
ncbi:sugar phosphate isomerase/epimerase family protein [Rhizobium hidalgonense]|uniref:sugar phosphate isomerase/epimerase family protein n=1 Tax=Rhizobium hidalgonense TaxID=1538159 RepID=UPI0028728ACE|nr:TIM barrel protein [Rhizobium hidalgonense]MDR9802764.1 sugar phosphate isomerase/epimerase [Rhizobium hidalgonense]